MKSLWGVVAHDLSRYVGTGGTLGKIKCILVSHGFHLVVLYRLGVALSKVLVLGPFLRPFMEYVIRIIYASDISLKSQIGPGLMIVHGHDIVIGGDVSIGDNCKILNGVTLGNKDTESCVNAQPVLGNNIVIGSGAKILGQIKIGDNVIIGANSVVLKDAPENVIVVGVPARVVIKS